MRSCEPLPRESSLTEEELLDRLRAAKRVFLLEPGYGRKYLPLGLAKIATFVKANGGKVWFGRNYFGPPVDLICVSSLFTYDSAKVIRAILRGGSVSRNTPMIVGGIYASLMAQHLQENTDARAEIFTGYSPVLDQLVPDYSLAWGMEDPWNDFSYTFTSRGCPNKCSYCAVWRIEPQTWLNPRWRDHILPSKPCAMISDNNLSSTPDDHLFSVLDYLTATGKKVVFDNGFDAKHITDSMAARLSRLKYTRTGMRLAFDRIDEDEVFHRAVEKLIAAGVPRTEIMVYALFNFKDMPREALYRLGEIHKLGVRPYPTMYTPLNQHEARREKHFVGRYWTWPLVRVFRTYWLMAGIYSKMNFWEYAKTQDKVELGDEDWEKLNAEWRP